MCMEFGITMNKYVLGPQSKEIRIHYSPPRYKVDIQTRIDTKPPYPIAPPQDSFVH